MSRSITRERRSILVVLLVCFAMLMSYTAAAEELDLLHCWGGQRAPWVEEMVKAFEDEHPGVKVNVQLSSCGNALLEAFLTAYAGGVAPDVVMIQATNIPSAAESGALIPLSPYLDKNGITEDTWFPAEIASGRWEGTVYGLPIRTGSDSNSLMFYNIDMLEAAGIGEVPKTWDELEEVSKRLIRYHEDQLVTAAYTPHGGDMPSLGWLTSGGGKLFSEDGKQILFDEPESIAVGQYLHDHFTQHYNGLKNLDAEIGSSQARRLAAFTSNRLAFNFDGSWIFSFIEEQAPDLRYGIALRPTKEPDGMPGLHANTFHYAIPNGVDNPDLAWELLEWLTLKEETAGNFMILQDRASPVIEFSRNPIYWEINPYWNVVIEAMSRSGELQMYPYTYDVAVLYGNALRSAMRGDEAPEIALTEAARKAQAMVDEYWASREGK